MTKSDALKIFGSASNLAAAMGVATNSIYQWAEELPLGTQDRIYGAALRLGMHVPSEAVSVDCRRGVTKTKAVRLFGGARKLAAALGVSTQSVYGLCESPTSGVQQRIYEAAVRLGLPVDDLDQPREAEHRLPRA